MMTIQASVTILTKDSERHLKEVLASVIAFDEVVVLDSGSSDTTLDIAKAFPNVTIYESSFEGFGAMHNKASSYARNDWVLSLDSDEVLSESLVAEIKNAPLDEERVYSFPFHNYFNGRHIKWCGWYPDRHVRMYNKKKTLFTDAYVHEGIITKGLKEHLFSSHVTHYSYSCVSDFLTKMQRYSDYFAQQNEGKKTSSVLKAVSHGIWSFFRSYIIKRGVFGGYEGFIISLYNGHTALYKYLKLRERNATRK
jgi:glycosyltransferase involved in cell wall biosynthesis